MRTQFSKLTLAASIVLAMAFTFSCSSDKDDDNSGGSPSEYTSGSCNASDYGGVEIGDQVWMSKNWGCYAQGSKCYNNDPANCEKYGRLYDWATAMALPSSCNTSSCAGQITAKHKGICPVGWHIPSDADWNALMKVANPSCSDNRDCEGAGTKLKATSGWDNSAGGKSGNGTDDFGFAALPGGLGTNGGFSLVGKDGNWWSASEYVANYAYRLNMYYINERTSWFYLDKGNHLFSVRCVQD